MFRCSIPLTLSIFILGAAVHAGEVITLKAITAKESAPVTIAAGESFKYLSASQISSSYVGRAYMRVLLPEMGSTWLEFEIWDEQYRNFPIAGPATVVYARPGNTPAIMSIEVTRSASFNPTIPTSAVVIPNDATGQFEVILESSTDMITWTAALPGTYGGSTEKRFFRTRIQRAP